MLRSPGFCDAASARYSNGSTELDSLECFSVLEPRPESPSRRLGPPGPSPRASARRSDTEGSRPHFGRFAGAEINAARKRPGIGVSEASQDGLASGRAARAARQAQVTAKEAVFACNLADRLGILGDYGRVRGSQVPGPPHCTGIDSKTVAAERPNKSTRHSIPKEHLNNDR